MKFERLCRIFHVSDLHFVTAATRNEVQQSNNIATRALRLLFSQGSAPHDPDALSECVRAIRREIDGDPGWQTLIIVTGDLTTWGDRASLAGATKVLSDLGQETGSRLMVLFGNHDVWPGEEPWFPAFATTAQIGSSSVRAAACQVPNETSLRLPTAIALEFHRLNTVLADRMLNSLAWGLLDQPSLDRLRAETKGTLSAIGVALTHHPVHDTTPSPLPSTLINCGGAAEALRFADGPQIRMVLSGHRHVQHPPAGELQASHARGHLPLAHDQVQFTAGTASQYPERSQSPSNSFQMLRLGLGSQNSTLVIERTTFVLPNGIGRFVKMGDRDEVAETCTLSLR